MNAKVPFNIRARQQGEKPKGFGEERAEQMEKRLNKAIAERRKLAAAEQASEEPISSYIGKRGSLVERSISRMQKLLEK